MRLTVLFILFSFFLRAQRDTCISAPLVCIHFAGQIPSGDMVKRFGNNMLVGASFKYKTNKNFVYGIEFNYLYGKTVKEDVMKQLKTPEGNVVDNAGNPADLRITERGAILNIQVGKVFAFSKRNRNSGLFVSFGGGLLQHKINLYDAQQRIAAVKGELKYGYDRLSFGFGISEFVGYMFLSKNHLANFYIGFESLQAKTHSLRVLNYDTGLRDTQQRLDILTGLKFGWVLPLYKRRPNDYYYN